MKVEHVNNNEDSNDRNWLPLSFEESLGAFLLFILFLITFGNVITRYLTDVSFAFTEEISVALMVVLALVGASVAVARDRHLRVTYLIDKLPAPMRGAFEQFTLAATLVTFLVLTVYGAVAAYQDWRDQVTTPGLDISQWLYTMWLPVFSALIVFRAAWLSVRRWTTSR